ncbi:hypothetical protein V2J09_011057 [Rumex salicifolius]
MWLEEKTSTSNQSNINFSFCCQEGKIKRSMKGEALTHSGNPVRIIRVGSLLPQTGSYPRYAQLYFYDAENELQNKLNCMKLCPGDVDEDLVKEPIRIFDANSSVAKACRMARDWCDDNTTQDITIKLIGQRQPRQK